MTQCITQTEVFEQFARVSKLIEGTALQIQDVFKVDNKLLRALQVSQRPELYTFALALIEGTPVFPGDTLYALDYKRQVKVQYRTAYGLFSVGVTSCGVDFGNEIKVSNLTWEIPKPTFTLNGIELPLPSTGAMGYYLLKSIQNFHWDSSEDRDKVQEALEKLLNGG